MIVEGHKTGTVIAIIVALNVGGGVAGCGSTACGDCVTDYAGLVIKTAEPVTMVTLSGTACTGSRFRCVPADFDDTIHDPCTTVQLDAKAEGLCVVELTVGGAPVRLERQMSRRPPGCCGGFIGEANHEGYIDLSAGPDAGTDGEAADLGGG